ncbi:MAG: hypothetical protein IPF58_06405 [Saprospirales bacterium]|nr:hypothetical protein [Saprospirales bacterium]
MTVQHLPDIECNDLVFVLTEEIEVIRKLESNFMVISYNQEEIFREEISFEYFERFIEVANLLKEKYHNQIVDFKLEVNGYLLYGDSVKAFFDVEQFLRTVKGNRAS